MCLPPIPSPPSPNQQLLVPQDLGGKIQQNKLRHSTKVFTCHGQKRKIVGTSKIKKFTSNNWIQILILKKHWLESCLFLLITTMHSDACLSSNGNRKLYSTMCWGFDWFLADVKWQPVRYGWCDVCTDWYPFSLQGRQGIISAIPAEYVYIYIYNVYLDIWECQEISDSPKVFQTAQLHYETHEFCWMFHASLLRQIHLDIQKCQI